MRAAAGENSPWMSTTMRRSATCAIVWKRAARMRDPLNSSRSTTRASAIADLRAPSRFDLIQRLLQQRGTGPKRPQEVVHRLIALEVIHGHAPAVEARLGYA